MKKNSENRVVSRLKALCGNSGPSRFHRGVQIERFVNQVFKLKSEELDLDFEGGHQASSYVEMM